MSVLATQSRNAQPGADGINNEGMSAVIIVHRIGDILDHEFKQKLRNAVLLGTLEVGRVVHVSKQRIISPDAPSFDTNELLT